MKVFVTGATGFVGRPFIERILKEDFEVVLITRDARRVSDLNCAHLTVYEADVRDTGALERIAGKEKEFDAVFHLAASLDYFGRDNSLYLINVEGTRNILRLAVKTRAKKFIYASSIEAVGPVAINKIPAGRDTALRPASAYGRTKVLAEKLVADASKKYFQAKILRIGNVYGPGHDNFIIEIADAILKHNRVLEFLPVYADRYMQPAYNKDVTEGILSSYRHECPFAILTLAGDYVTVVELFTICSKIMDSPFKIKKKSLADALYLTLRQKYSEKNKQFDLITYLMTGARGRVHRAVSLEEAERILGPAFKTDLKEGIKTTLEWAGRSGVLKW